MNKRLEAKIKARNRINAYIKENAPKIFAAVAPFVGQKFYTVGDMTVKVRKVVDSFSVNDQARRFQVYRYYYNGTFALIFKAWEPDGEFSVTYDEVTVYFGNIDNQILTKLYDFNPENYPSDYSFDKVSAIQAEIEKKQAEIRSLESQIAPFLNTY